MTDSQTLRRRIGRGLGATALGYGFNLIAQLVSERFDAGVVGYFQRMDADGPGPAARNVSECVGGVRLTTAGKDAPAGIGILTDKFKAEATIGPGY